MALDWSKIDNDKIFQRMVNHLFALECNSPGFIPSSPYAGADGVWDGRHDGCHVPFGAENIDLLLIVAQCAQESSKTAGIRSMLSSHVFPSGTVSSAVGQAPPEWARRKTIFLEMARRAGPGLLSSILKDLAERLDACMEHWQKKDDALRLLASSRWLATSKSRWLQRSHRDESSGGGGNRTRVP